MLSVDLRTYPSILVAFHTVGQHVSSMQVNFEEVRIPRSRSQFVLSKMVLYSLYEYMILFCLWMTRNTLHLVTFNARLILVEPSSKLDRSFCRRDASTLE